VPASGMVMPDIAIKPKDDPARSDPYTPDGLEFSPFPSVITLKRYPVEKDGIKLKTRNSNIPVKILLNTITLLKIIKVNR
jgi:hypothetical protein